MESKDKDKEMRGEKSLSFSYMNKTACTPAWLISSIILNI